MSDLIDTIDPGRHAIFEASAGTGKTYAIGRYVLRLLREGRARLDQILLVTFTEKATGELKDRLRRELEAEVDAGGAAVFRQALDQYDQAPIFTIHGFCNWLLSHFASELGQDFRFELIDDHAAIEPVFREVQKREWHRVFEKSLAQTLKAADYKRGEADDWERKVRDLANKYRPEAGHRILPDVADLAAYPEEYRLAVVTIRRVQEMLANDKRQRGQLSYDDMISRVAHGLDPAKNPRAPALLAELRERFRFAIVDEFQDTDPIQWDIFRRLFLEGASRLILVGDPKQAIYGFRGADLPTYLRATKQMTRDLDAVEYPLTINWRSTPELLDALNRFFDDGGYFPKECGLTYHRVSPPSADMARTKIVRDDTGRGRSPSSTSTRFRAVGRPGNSTRNWSPRRSGRFSTVEKESRRSSSSAATGRGLSRRATSVCSCSRGTRRSRSSRPSTRRGIAHAFYKKGGVRESAEARDIRHVLRALASPHDEGRFERALLTSFFRIPPAEAIAGGTLPATHPAARPLPQVDRPGRESAVERPVRFADRGDRHPLLRARFAPGRTPAREPAAHPRQPARRGVSRQSRPARTSGANRQVHRRGDRRAERQSVAGERRAARAVPDDPRGEGARVSGRLPRRQLHRWPEVGARDVSRCRRSARLRSAGDVVEVEDVRARGAATQEPA